MIINIANLAEQRALEKAGFEREGVLRQAQWRAGHWHDQVLYSTLRPARPGIAGEQEAPAVP